MRLRRSRLVENRREPRRNAQTNHACPKLPPGRDPAEGEEKERRWQSDDGQVELPVLLQHEVDELGWQGDCVSITAAGSPN